MQKGESQNGGKKKTKYAKFSEKRIKRNARFSENLVWLVFLLISFYNLPFCHIKDELVPRNVSESEKRSE